MNRSIPMCHARWTSDPETRSRQNLAGLGIHAAAYVVVCAWMAVTNLATSPGHLWFVWPVVGWGLGLAMHLVGVLYFETLTDEQKRAWLARERSHGCPRTPPEPTPGR